MEKEISEHRVKAEQKEVELEQLRSELSFMKQIMVPAKRVEDEWTYFTF